MHVIVVPCRMTWTLPHISQTFHIQNNYMYFRRRLSETNGNESSDGEGVEVKIRSCVFTAGIGARVWNPQGGYVGRAEHGGRD